VAAIQTAEKQLQHLTQIELARRWRMSPRTLERWRWLKRGPAYLKLGHVLYRLEDVEAFEQEHVYLRPAAPTRWSSGSGPKHSALRQAQ
jgi:Helix-turn-helix domain